MRRWVSLVAVGVLVVAPSLLWGSHGPQTLDDQVRHQLVMLPYYGVFDNLSYQVEGNTVVLSGEVTDPVLKRDAEDVVKHIPGVQSVDNKIEVLPLSSFDDQIRWAELRAVYGNPALNRYALPPVSPVRIIVKNGHVTLEGVVASAFDKNVAGVAANKVPGVFSVTNDLVVNKI